MGGPAVCAPAASCSDKKVAPMRIQFSEDLSDDNLRNRADHHTIGSGWRSFLSLRDPAALTGRRGHPTNC